MLNFIKRYWPTVLATLILLTALTGVYAKYVVDKTITGTASITAQLGSIKLLESKANPNSDGSYTLDANNTVQSNTYDTVIPGLDIPKDPYVQITDKTAIPVYVYLKIDENTLPATMTYTLELHWTLVTDYTDVYVYSDSNGDPILVTKNIEIPVLKNDTIYVSQDLNTTSFTEAKLSFSACMKQYVENNTAKQIYENT